MHTPQGETIHAVYGFCRMLKKLVDQFKTPYCMIAWDSWGKTDRATVYTEYKATRQAAPSDLSHQRTLIKEFASLIGIKQIEMQGVEADDLLYSAAKIFNEAGLTSILVTTDKDLGQVLNEHIFMFDSFKDALITRGDLEHKYGFSLDKLPFYFALIGDASDNIPGVRGIGPKTAQELVVQFESLEDLYANLDKVPRERTRLLLQESRDNAFISFALFKLRYYELRLSPQDVAFNVTHWSNAKPFFEKLAFKSLLKDMVPEQEKIEKVTVAHRLGVNLKTVQTLDQLYALVAEIKSAGHVAVDTETDGLSALQANLVGLCLATRSNAAYYVPCGHTTGEQLSCEVIKEMLRDIFADPAIKKYMHSAKFDLHILLNAGLETKGLVFDTLVAASLVTQDWQRIGLKYLSEFYLHEPMLTYDEIVTQKGYKNFREVPLDSATLYAASDAHQTLELVPILQEELKIHEQEKLFHDIEFPLISLLVAMEREGIYCDTAVLDELNRYLIKDIQKIREHIIDIIGENYKSINFNSPKQLSELLFNHLKLMPVKKTGQKTNFSTDQEVLEALAKEHPVPALIIEYRELFKLKSTYVDALPAYVNKKTNRIHTSFSQTVAATGRLASSEPNLQNVPPLVRKAFKPRDGYLFLSADYSQIELRVLAYLSQDATLVHAFNTGEDIHKRTAAGLFQAPFNEVTSEQRQVAKRINFSILYGMTPFGLSKDLGIPFAQAKEYIDRFMAQYPGVQRWMEEVVRETEQHGYVTTFWGRRRYLPGIYEKNKTLYELARRLAINTKGQGTAAEIMKIGMLNLHKSLLSQKLNAKIILQIHDELLLEVPHEEIEQTKQIVQEILQHVVKWNIPLEVTTRMGKDWHEVSK